MNIAVSFSLRFVENMLNVSQGSFQNVLSRVITFYHFLSIFLPLNDVFTLIKICSIDKVSSFIVYNAYSGQTLSLRLYLE